MFGVDFDIHMWSIIDLYIVVDLLIICSKFKFCNPEMYSLLRWLLVDVVKSMLASPIMINVLVACRGSRMVFCSASMSVDILLDVDGR